jgi:hypothetical protein
MSMHDHVDNLILNPAVSFAVHCTAAPAAKAAAPKAVAAKTAKAAPAPAKDADSESRYITLILELLLHPQLMATHLPHNVCFLLLALALTIR